MKPDRSLKRRISRTFLLQAAAISVAAVVSVLLAAAVIRQVLVTEALRLEAAYFWDHRAANAGHPLPDTRNLRGYLAPVSDASALPARLRGLDDGFHSLPSEADFTTVHVSTRGGQRLFLVFDGERVDELAAYFGLVPLVAVLLVLYVTIWLSYRASHRAVSPVSWLAREVDRLDPEEPLARRFDPQRLPADGGEEVEVLAAALASLAERLDAFVERERNFTRDASHELRTPLTVIRVATDLLREHPDLTPAIREGIQRIRRASDDMEQLVEAFLLLAREGDQGLPRDLVCLNDLVAGELDRLRLLVAGKPVEVSLEAEGRVSMQEPEQAVSAVVRNLLRNALAYTEAGRVTVQISRNALVIEDSGVGMDEQALRRAFEPYARGETRGADGHGVGLTIVQRFCDRFHWPLRMDSRPGQGTRVEVCFPNAVFRAEAGSD